jgi:hypothetical protein
MRSRNILLAILLTGMGVIWAADSDSTEPATLVLANADYNENFMANGKLVTVLKGNVHFIYDDAHIYSKTTTWYRSDGIARFEDSVRIVQPDQTLKCRRLDFMREKKQVILTGDIDLWNTKDQVRLRAQKGVYHMDTKAIELDREPYMMRFDTTAHDTLEIKSARMLYNDSLKIATAIDSVTILKGELNATCRRAYYYVDDDVALLRIKPHLLYDIHTLDGDSMNLFFRDERLRGITVTGNAKAVHNDFTSADSVITLIDGDSLHLQISAEGRIDTTWVYRNVKSRYFSRSAPDQTNEAGGKMMQLTFNAEGSAKKLVVKGNAQSTYYIDGESGTGRNEASGDQIDLFFSEGRATYITLIGAVRGIYFAQQRR